MGNRASIQLLRDSFSTNNKATIICPPFPYLAELKEPLEKLGIRLGAQNLNEHDKGAFTGEVSAQMLKDIGCEFVLIGHSERRTLFKETDAIIALKFHSAINAGLTPILCVVETAQERAADHTTAVITKQLDAVFSEGFPSVDFIIAYDPVWAIGTGNSASPEQADEVHQLIRAYLGSQNATVKIVYGGSVNAKNAAHFLEKKSIDGALIGSASLDPAQFSVILDAAK